MDRRFCTIATPSATLLAVTAKVPRSASAVETLSLTSKRLMRLYCIVLRICIYFNVRNNIIIVLYHVNQHSIVGRFSVL